MNLLLICIFINGLIGLIFKVLGKYQVDTFQAIMFNYVTCVVCGVGAMGYGHFRSMFVADWLWIVVLLGFLFVVIFNVYARSIEISGVGISTIFQKMSLIAPVVIAFAFFGDPISTKRIIGIGVAILALFLLSKSDNGWKLDRGLWLLIIVFVGSCIIDVCLFLSEEMKLAPGGDIRLVTGIFFFAFIFGSLYWGGSAKRRNTPVQVRNVVGGIALGIPNFFSIYLLLKVLAKGWDGSVVFPALNVGVLSIATFGGYLFFKESLDVKKWIGFGCAVLAIALLAMS